MAASDHAAFRRAIAADPADLTSRLVYADFLEDTGEPPHVARANFIRTQIEADGLPPTDPRRIGLERRTAKLFAENWVEWWLSVCALVGLPMPYVPGNRLRERVARALGRGRLGGEPYSMSGCSVSGLYSPGQVAYPQYEVAFRRGFPEAVQLSSELGEAAVVIRRWADAQPLSWLGLRGAIPRDWVAIRGEHLANVAGLRLYHCHTEVVRAVLESPHMARVDDLELYTDRVRARLPAEQLQVLADSPVATRVRRLRVDLANHAEAGALVRPDRWAALAELTVRCGWVLDGSDPDTVEALAGLAEAPFLRQLRSLALDTFGRAAGGDGSHLIVGPAVEAAVLRLLGALDPGRLRRLDLGWIEQLSPAVGALVAERFGGGTVPVP